MRCEGLRGVPRDFATAGAVNSVALAAACGRSLAPCIVVDGVLARLLVVVLTTGVSSLKDGGGDGGGQNWEGAQEKI